MATKNNSNPNDPRNPLNRPEVPQEDKLQHLRDNIAKRRGEFERLETFQNEKTGQHTVIGRRQNNQVIILGSSDQPVDLKALEADLQDSSRGGKGHDQGKGSGASQQKAGGNKTPSNKSKAKAA